MTKLHVLTERELSLAAGGASSIPIFGPLIDWLRGAGGCTLPAGGQPTPNLGPNRPLVPTPPTPVPFMDPPASRRGRAPGRDPLI